MLRSGARAGQGPAVSAARASASRKTPPRMIGSASSITPSSSMVRENGGIEPGCTPPTSAWWPRAATKKAGSALAVDEHRHDHGDVRQVGAAGVGVVERERLAGRELRVARRDRPHAGAHRAQVHRHVRRVGDQAAVGVEQGAGEVEPLLDVHRVRRPLQRRAHRLGDAHEAAVVELERDRIGASSAAGAALARRCRCGRGGSGRRPPSSPASPARPQIWVSARTIKRPPPRREGAGGGGLDRPGSTSPAWRRVARRRSAGATRRPLPSRRRGFAASTSTLRDQRSARSGSTKPNRRRCAASNAAFDRARARPAGRAGRRRLPRS